MKNVLKTLVKSVLIPITLTTEASANDAATYQKKVGSGAATLIVLNEEINDIIKIVKSIEESGLLMKGASKTIKMNKRTKMRDFLECC